MDTVELLGAERLVYAKVGGEGFIVRIDESQPAPKVGETIHVSPREDRMHWFDAETGKRV